MDYFNAMFDCANPSIGVLKQRTFEKMKTNPITDVCNPICFLLTCAMAVRTVYLSHSAEIQMVSVEINSHLFETIVKKTNKKTEKSLWKPVA